MTLLPKFTATPVVNRLIIIGQYLGQIKLKLCLESTIRCSEALRK